MERQSRSNFIEVLFAGDESVVSSTIREDPAEQNQTQSLTNPNRSNTVDTSENDKVSILGSESVAKNVQKEENVTSTLFTRINV